MPIIQVNMLEGRTVQQKRAMVAAVTSAIVESLGAKPETVRVIIKGSPEGCTVANRVYALFAPRPPPGCGVTGRARLAINGNALAMFKLILMNP